MTEFDKLASKTHAVGVVVIRTDAEGVTSILAHSYEKHGIKTLRVPVETGEPGETVRETLRRVMFEEVAADPARFAFAMLAEDPCFFELALDDVSKQATHLKAFFKVEIVKGEPRRVPLIELEGTEAEERLGPLVWWEAAELLRRMKQTSAPRVHRLAVSATV